MAGAPMNPAWYTNLVARPAATVEANRETFAVRATEVGGKERDRLYRQHAEELPQFRDYPSKTERLIPVFVLERVA
jgi:deazaflavin-dependent oxidoreductase (nitroreductase family)